MMEKLKCPCVNWYPESFMAGTRRMTNEEVGVYIRALNVQFIEGGIEPDEFEEFPPRVKKKFVERGGLYVNERMEYEINQKRKYSESRANNRKKKDSDQYAGHTKTEWETLSIDERIKAVTT